MAQWLGQFSGQTHATRVEDAEDSLRHAVEVFRSAVSSESRQKAKAVNSLAKLVMTSRLKILKARIAAAEKDVQNGVALPDRVEEIASLRRKEATMREGGLDAALREFGAHDIPVA